MTDISQYHNDDDWQLLAIPKHLHNFCLAMPQINEIVVIEHVENKAKVCRLGIESMSS